SLAAVLSLALGIGSCVAAFRLIDALLWRPLPVANSSRLYVLSSKLTGPEGRPIEDDHWATPNFNLMRDAVRDDTRDQADLIAVSDADRTDITWSTDDDMEKAHVVFASGNMFPLFGLEPALGRLIAPADDRAPGVGPYAVLSWDYWNHRFGRDPHVLGRSLHIGDQTVEIRSEEHTSELQSHSDLVCRLLLEKKRSTWVRHGCIGRAGASTARVRGRR